MNVIIFAALVVFVTFNYCETFNVYNCSEPDLEYETISLIDLPKCEYKNFQPKIDRINGYIVQEIRRKTITVRKCLVTVFRNVYNCDTGHGDAKSYTRRMNRTICSDMHDYRKYNYHGHQWVDNLQINRTNSISAVIAGSMNEHGNCTGANFADEFTTPVNAVVQERYDVKLQQYSSIVDTISQELSLPNGLRCHLDKGQYEDNDGAIYYWELEFEKHHGLMESAVVIYKGELNFLTYPHPPTKDSYQENDYRYAVLNNTKNFVSLRLQTKMESYIQNRNIEIYKTNVPDLYVFEWKYPDSPLINVSLADSDVSQNIQYLAKLTGIDQHLFQHLSQLISSTSYNDCVLNRAILGIQLSYAYTNPSEFAYLYYNGPGAMAHVYGDVIHITRCPAVNATIRSTEECYTNIPVKVSGEEMFANTRTRILQAESSQISCSEINKMIIKNDDSWVECINQSLLVEQPTAFDPFSSLINTNSWSYKPMYDIISGGLYSYEQIEKSRKAFAHPTSPSSVDDSSFYKISINGPEASTMANQILYYLISELVAFWNFCLAIGRIFTGIVGIWFIYEIISFVFWMIVDLFAFGFSWELLKAFCVRATAAVLSTLMKRFSAMKKSVDRHMRPVVTKDKKYSPPGLGNLSQENPTYDTLDFGGK